MSFWPNPDLQMMAAEQVPLGLILSRVEAVGSNVKVQLDPEKVVANSGLYT